MALANSKTIENLKAAFAGESQANRRYLYFAQKADVEGYNDVAAVFRRAFARLRNGRGGPVLVEVPLDIWHEDIPGELHYTPVSVTRSGPDPKDVERAARALIDAKRPVLYVGQGVHYAKAWKQVRHLAELLALPVTTSLEGKSAFPETHPLALGTGGLAMPRTVRDFLDESDVIFGVVALIGGTSGPRFSVPKYFSTSFFVCAGSKSPTIARPALFGA